MTDDERHATTQRITIPTVTRRGTRARFPIAVALLDFWDHPHSPRHRNFAYFAARRARARGVEIFDGREG